MPEAHPADFKIPEICRAEFLHIKDNVAALAVKVDDMNTKLFESNGDSYSTRVKLVETWIENEIRTRAFLNKWFYGLLAALIIQISLGVWNRIEILHNGQNIAAVVQKVSDDKTADKQHD